MCVCVCVCVFGVEMCFGCASDITFRYHMLYIYIIMEKGVTCVSVCIFCLNPNFNIQDSNILEYIMLIMQNKNDLIIFKNLETE